MRKKVFGRQLKRDKNERKALFKSLLSSLVLYESIQTTEAKAKAIKSDADKLITKAKKGGLHSLRLVQPKISTKAVKKLLDIIAPRFAGRQGGYTRIIRTGKRLKDNAQEVILQWTTLGNLGTMTGESSKDTKKIEGVREELAASETKAAKKDKKAKIEDKKTEDKKAAKGKTK